MRPVRLADWMDRPDRRRTPVTIGLFLALLSFGVLDSVTGADVSLGVFYVLLVVAVTVCAGAAVGIGAAAFSAVLWGAADVVTSPSGLSVWIDVWNLLTRFAVHAIVVLLLAALLRALRVARESEARSRLFLATAAHQLRTPIAALRASVDALLLEGATPAQERLLANLGGEATRLGHLATSLLRTARLDQGEAVRPRPVDVRTLARQEIERVSGLGGAECRLRVDAAVPPAVVLEPEATAEIIANLLDNARRHAASGIDVRVACGRGRLVVEIGDDGPGLPSGAEARAFERFVTLDGQGGTGLGLPIARELARRQGGDLTYAARTFRLQLPLRPAPAGGPDGARGGPPADGAGRRPAGRGLRGPAGRAVALSALAGWALVGGALAGFGVPARAAPPTCLGQPATIVATGTGGEIITGTDGPDVIVGSAGPDTIDGRGGDDVICGMGGDDVIYGGPGHDTIDGGDGDDRLYGGDGPVDGGPPSPTDRDSLDGGAGNDTLYAGAGDADLRGGPGDDRLYGGPGNDALDGGPGSDVCDGGGGRNTATNCETVIRAARSR